MSTPSVNKTAKRSVAILAVGLVAMLTALACEVVIRLATLASPNLESKIYNRSLHPHVKDPILGIRGNPAFPGHDANGYRNLVVLKRAGIVAIGDSQTYGTSVAPQYAWSRRLGQRLGVDVYNMAHGGYGPSHYERLAQEAIALTPRMIVIGIYFGNDFYDNWLMYLREASRYQVPDVVLAPAQEREKIKPLADEVFKFFKMGARRADQDAHEGGLRRILARNSALYGFVRAIKNAAISRPADVSDLAFDTAVAALTPKQLEYASVFDGGAWRTIFTARYRFLVEDISDPRILVGRWITMRAAELILELSRAKGLDVVFLLLPTKECVFAEMVADPGAHPYLSRLVADESEHRRVLIAHLQRIGAAYIDPMPALRSSASQPYFENADGHPNELGHDVIANTVVQALGARFSMSVGK